MSKGFNRLGRYAVRPATIAHELYFASLKKRLRHNSHSAYESRKSAQKTYRSSRNKRGQARRNTSPRAASPIIQGCVTRSVSATRDKARQNENINPRNKADSSDVRDASLNDVCDLECLTLENVVDHLLQIDTHDFFLTATSSHNECCSQPPKNIDVRTLENVVKRADKRRHPRQRIFKKFEGDLIPAVLYEEGLLNIGYLEYKGF